MVLRDGLSGRCEHVAGTRLPLVVDELVDLFETEVKGRGDHKMVATLEMAIAPDIVHALDHQDPAGPQDTRPLAHPTLDQLTNALVRLTLHQTVPIVVIHRIPTPTPLPTTTTSPL